MVISSKQFISFKKLDWKSVCAIVNGMTKMNDEDDLKDANKKATESKCEKAFGNVKEKIKVWLNTLCLNL